MVCRGNKGQILGGTILRAAGSILEATETVPISIFKEIIISGVRLRMDLSTFVVSGGFSIAVKS